MVGPVNISTEHLKVRCNIGLWKIYVKVSSEKMLTSVRKNK